MFLSTINKLKEEKRRTDSLVVINAGNTLKNHYNRFPVSNDNSEYRNDETQSTSCKYNEKTVSLKSGDYRSSTGRGKSGSKIKHKDNSSGLSSLKDALILAARFKEKENCTNKNGMILSAGLPYNFEEKKDQDPSECSDSGIRFVRIKCTNNTKNTNSNVCYMKNTEHSEKSDKSSKLSKKNATNISEKGKNRGKESINCKIGNFTSSVDISKTNSEYKNSVGKNVSNKKEESCDTSMPKRGISSLKIKNNLIKKKYKKTNTDFFENFAFSTPNGTSSKRRTSLGSSSPNKKLSLLTPEMVEFEDVKTGLTPTNEDIEESGNKASKREQNNKIACTEFFDLSPIGNLINEKKYYNTDEGTTSKSLKNSVGKVIGDILSGLDTSGFKGKLKHGKLSCEKQNKFITQLHEKLSSGKDNNSTIETNANSVSNVTPSAVSAKQITVSLENALEKQSGINRNLKNQEDEHELLWSIEEDSTLRSEEKDLFMQEVIAERE